MITNEAKTNFKEKYVINHLTNCWNWSAATNSQGYGVFGAKMGDGTMRTCSSHRFSFEIYKGEIPEGMMILHECDNRKCVNPEHLTLGTHIDNMNGMSSLIAEQERQFQDNLKWIMSNTSLNTKKKAIRFALMILRNVVSTEHLQRYAQM